jgi:hypothetical protein
MMCCHRASHLSPPLGTWAIVVEVDGLVVARDGEGGGADELVGAHTLVQAVPEDVEHLRALPSLLCRWTSSSLSLPPVPACAF